MQAWIIDQLKQQEPVEQRPFLELPLESPIPKDREEVELESERGVIIIKIYDEEDEED